MTDQPTAPSTTDNSTTQNLTTTQTAQTPQTPSVDTPASPRTEFLRSLPEEYREDAAFASFQNTGDLAKSYKHAAALVGMDKNRLLVVPQSPDDKAGYDKIYTALGRPETPEGYSYEKPEGIEQVDEEFLGWFKGLAHKTGLSASAFKQITQEYDQKMLAAQKAQQEQQEQALKTRAEEVRKTYGAATDEREGLVAELFKRHGGDDAVKLFNENKYLLPAEVYDMYVKIATEYNNMAKEFGDDRILNGTKASQATLSPEEASSEIARLQADREFMAKYNSKENPQHQWAVDQMARLFKLRAGIKA